MEGNVMTGACSMHRRKHPEKIMVGKACREVII
jgi:hypothetical protein